MIEFEVFDSNVKYLRVILAMKGAEVWVTARMAFKGQLNYMIESSYVLVEGEPLQCTEVLKTIQSVFLN